MKFKLVENKAVLYPSQKTDKNTESIIIENGVKRIDKYAFYGYTSLEQVTIPNSVTHIESGAFARCTSLEQVTIPNSVTYIGDNSFVNCTSLEQIIIPDSVTIIGDCAFCGCTSLKQVIIHANNINFGYDVFRDSELVTIINTTSNAYIENYAKLNNITYEDASPGVEIEADFLEEE